jgi:hypothetical protein
LIHLNLDERADRFRFLRRESLKGAISASRL